MKAFPVLLLAFACARAAGPAPRGLAGAPGADTGEPSLFRNADGTVCLTWSGPGDRPGERALRFATLAPGATAWSAARTIVSTPRLMENWADFATLTATGDGTWWAQWFQSRAAGAHGYDGWCARSSDGGHTWTDPAPLGHEFVSLAPLSGGRVLAVWLESARVRAPAAPRAPKDPPAPYAPSMRLKARLLAPDGSTLRDWVVDPDTCACCQTTLALLPGDRAIVAYRAHTPDEVRDNCVALFTGEGWTPPRTLHDDGWRIPACPVNGPAADTLGERTAIAWFTAAAGVARVQAKQSPDGGLTFGPALPLDLGRPIGRLDLVMLADGSAVIAWLEAQTGLNAAGLYVRRMFPDGALSAPQLLAGMSAVRASGFPRMATRPGDDLPVVVAWTDVSSSDPADPKSSATTRVRTAGLSAAALVRSAPTASSAVAGGRAVRAAFRAGGVVFLELCATPAHPESTPPGSLSDLP